MAFPTILVNNGTGSDTAASGAGPSTAVSGTGASLNATTTVDLSADSPDLSGITTDGSEALWVDTTSGRMFGRITAVDDGADTVTVHAAFDVTESSRNWGIGGKRATTKPTVSSRLGVATVPPDSDGEAWTVEVEYTGTAYDTLNINFNGCGSVFVPFTFKGSGSSRPELLHDQNVTISMFDAGGTSAYVKVDYLEFHASRYGYFTPMINSGTNSGKWHIKNCEFRGSLYAATNDAMGAILQNHNSGATASALILENCHIHHLGGPAVNRSSGQIGSHFRIFGCKIHDMGSHGLHLSRTVGSVSNCEIYDCGGDGIITWDAYDVGSPGLLSITNTVIHGCDGDGIDVTDHFAWAGEIRSCSITDNGGYGLNSTGQLHAEDYNLFNENSSGPANNHTIGSNSITSAAEYTDSANGDFTRSGTNRKAVGGPPETGSLTGTRTNFVDIGSLQEEEAGGGGGAIVNQGLQAIESGVTA